MQNPFDYEIELFDSSRRCLARYPAAINFEPALEAATFRAQRSGHPAVAKAGWRARIEPIPHPTAGAPYCGGIEVAIHTDGQESFRREFASSYFKPAAVTASAALVRKGVLKEGDGFQYLVTTRPRAAAPPVAAGMTLQTVAMELPA